MIFGLLLIVDAVAMPQVELVATVDDNLQVVSGTVTVLNGASVSFEDLLSALPMPGDDLTAHRTWPNSPEQGWVTMSPALSDGQQAFHSVLPRRYGASGTVPGHGLFANGLWHPQPIENGRPQLVHWDVSIALPEDTVGVINGHAGDGALQWQGVSERLSLSVIPHGEIRDVPLESGSLTVVDRRQRPKLDARLAAVLTESWPGASNPDAVVVVAPMRRRLTRPGAGMLYLSDRAFRLSARLWRFHIQAVRLGLLESMLPLPHAWQRRLGAGALVNEQPKPPDISSTLRFWSWLPHVDALVYSGQMPFFSDVFDEQWPGDRLADDLQELTERWVPGRVWAQRLDNAFGDGTAAQLTRMLLNGVSMSHVNTQLGVTEHEISRLAQWPETQDYILDVQQTDDEQWQTTIQRQAPAHALAEPVSLRIDGIERTVSMGPGPDTVQTVQPHRPQHVVLDPDRRLYQSSRANDQWPTKWTTIAYLSPAFVQDRIVGSANLGFRRQYSSRWLYMVRVYRSNRTQFGSDVSAIRSMGPLLDRRYRPLRLWMSAGASLLDPEFRPTEDGNTAINLSLGMSHDTRFAGNQSRSGHRLSVGASGGVIAGGSQQWIVAQGSAVGLLPVTGRLTTAGQLKGGVAAGYVEHQLLPLGGDGAVQGLPFDAMVGHHRLLVRPELRWMPLKHAAIAMPLLWVSDLHVNAGLDAGWVQRADTREQQTAFGWALSLGTTADLLGAEPSYGSIGVAGPIQQSGEPMIATDPDNLQFYVRISQTF